MQNQELGKNDQVQSVSKIMKSQEFVRNVAISGSFCNAIEYLYDIFIQNCGLFHQKDYVFDEVQKFSSQCKINSMIYKKINNKKGEEQTFLINLMKSKNNYHNQVDCLARLSDGAIIVINLNFGINYEIEKIIKTFLKEQNRLVFLINNIQKAFLKQKLDGEQIYLNLNKIIEKINNIIQIYEFDRTISPSQDQIIFGSAKYQWGFTCTQFAQFYEQKFGIESKKFVEKLWGDHFYDQSTHSWKTQQVDQSQMRAFVAYIMNPIIKLSVAVMNGEKEIFNQILIKLGIQLTADVKELNGKQLLKSILNNWINLSETIIQSCILYIPSPKSSQKYKSAQLCNLIKDEKIQESIQNCNSKGPLVMQICLMIPYQKDFIAIGRVFSGTIYTGQQIRIIGASQQHDKNQDLFSRTVESLFYFSLNELIEIEQGFSGSVIGIKGIDQFIRSNCTITDDQLTYSINPIQYEKLDLVRITVQPKNPINLPRVIEAIRQLIKLHPTISLQLEPYFLISGNSVHHLQCFMEELSQKYLANIEIIVSDYFMSYRETITQSSSENQVKTPNKHNIISGQAIPLSDNLLNQIESKDPKQQDTFKESAKSYQQKWFNDNNENLNIISFGPNEIGSNILVNKTTSDNYRQISEIQDHLITSWQWFTKEGALCEEELRGMQMNIVSYLSHADSIHRGPGQIIPTGRRLFLGSQLQAQPRLQEAVFVSEIHTNICVIDQIYKCLTNTKAVILEEQSFPQQSLQIIKAYVKGSQIIQLHHQLKQLKQNKVESFSSFDNWSIINSDPLEENSEAYQILQGIRAFKGLPIKLGEYF